MKAVLHPYQETAAGWLRERPEAALLLDMGLGKTLIALTALVTGLVLWFFFPNSVLMGASGVVFMLIVLASFAGMRTGTIPLTLILVLILYLGSEIFQAVTGTAGLAQLTHIAGGVLGMIFGFTWSRGKRAVR